MPQFTIRLNQIDTTEDAFAFDVERAWLESALAGTDVRAGQGDPVGKIQIRAYRSGPDVVLRGDARAQLVVACSRCLEDVKLDVKADLDLVMSEPPPGWDPESQDDLGREFFQGEEIVLDDIVRDHLLLELPMQPRCTDPPCPEWVKQYLTTAEEAEAQAAEKPVDPRLAPLAGLAGRLKPDKN